MTDDEYWNSGINQLEKNAAALKSIVGAMPPEKRAALEALLESEVGEQFIEAPASTRRSYHNAFPGGLLMHSLEVAANTVKIAEALAPGRWPKWKLLFVGLFHDIGKAGVAGKPYYVRETEKWKRERGEYYRVSNDEWIPAAENSVRVLGQFGVPMDHEEYCAIRLNDGPYEEDNRRYAFREPALSHIVHWADLWTTVEEKARG